MATMIDFSSVRGVFDEKKRRPGGHDVPVLTWESIEPDNQEEWRGLALWFAPEEPIPATHRN